MRLVEWGDLKSQRQLAKKTEYPTPACIYIYILYREPYTHHHHNAVPQYNAKCFFDMNHGYGTRKNRNQIRRFAGGAGGSSRQRSRGSSDGDE